MEHLWLPLTSDVLPTNDFAQSDSDSHKIVLPPLPELDATSTTLVQAHDQILGEDQWRISSLEYYRDLAVLQKRTAESRCTHLETELGSVKDRNVILEDRMGWLTVAYTEKARLEEEVDELKERVADGRERCERLEAEAKELKESLEREGKEKEKYGKLEGEVNGMQEKIQQRELEFVWSEKKLKREKAEVEKRDPRSTIPKLERRVNEKVVAFSGIVLTLLYVIAIGLGILE